MPNDPLALGRDMGEEAAQELQGFQFECRMRMLIGSLVGDGQGLLVILPDPGFAYRATAHIGAEISNGAAGMFISWIDLDMPVLPPELVE